MMSANGLIEPQMTTLNIVYVLTNPAMPGLVKIGYTYSEDAATRIAQLYSSGVLFLLSWSLRPR
jgi:hypothetical protein